MFGCIAGCCVRELISSNQSRLSTSEILGAEERGDAESNLTGQAAVADEASCDAGAPSQTALEMKLLSGLQQRVGARPRFRSEAPVAALGAELGFLLLVAASGLGRVAALRLRRHIAGFIGRLRGTQRLSFDHHLRMEKNTG